MTSRQKFFFLVLVLSFFQKKTLSRIPTAGTTTQARFGHTIPSQTYKTIFFGGAKNHFFSEGLKTVSQKGLTKPFLQTKRGGKILITKI